MTEPRNLVQRADRIAESIALIGFGGLVIMALLTFYDGAARFLGIPRLSGFSDYGELVFPIVIASCFPALLLRQKNLSIRLAGSVLGRRWERWIEFGAALVVFAFFSLLAWQLFLMTGDYFAAGRTTATIELQTGPFWAIATAIMTLCVPAQLLVVATLLQAALRSSDSEQNKHG